MPSGKGEVALMKRIISVLSVVAIIAALFAAMTLPAFAAANPDRAAEQAQIVSNYPPGTLGPAAKAACNPHYGGGERGCGDEVSARGNYGKTRH